MQNIHFLSLFKPIDTTQLTGNYVWK